MKNEDLTTDVPLDSSSNEALSAMFTCFLSGYYVSEAILEDYVKVVARLETITESEVHERVTIRAKEIYAENIQTIENLKSKIRVE